MWIEGISLEEIKRIYSLLDLTSLNEADHSAKIAVLCGKAVFQEAHVAAVCVYPPFVSQVALALRGTGVKTATVVNFPEGNDSLANVVAAIQQVIEEGAEELDVVFPYARYLCGEKVWAEEFIQACRAACGDRLLKVILETGALQMPAAIAAASELAIAAGADFLKTSTGKIAVGATLEAATVMLSVIKEQGRSHVGLKVSGGVRTVQQAVEYIALAEKTMGVDWVTPEQFRIGASQLADELIAKMGEAMRYK